MAETLINKTQAGDGIWTQDNLVAGTNISITQVEKPVIDENTTALWHLNGNLSSALDGGNQFWSSTGSYGAGKFDQALMYSSSSNSSTISFPNYTSSNNWTLDFWAKCTSDDYFTVYTYAASSSGIIFKYNEIQWVNGRTLNYPSGYNRRDFNHIAIVNDSNNRKCYLFLNGKKVDEYTGGMYIQSGALKYYGVIDEVRVSNVARWTSDFTPYSQPYGPAGGPAQYQINNTKSDPDLSSYLQNTATGSNSVTIAGTPSTTSNSTNVGFSSTAQGNYTTAIGTGATTVSSHYSTALGAKAYAAGNYSLAICSSGTATSTQAIGSESIAIGVAAIARADRAIAIGETSEATAQQAIAIGQSNQSTTKTQASGASAIAIGYNAKATAQSAIQLGTGTNSTANTFQVFNTTVVDANGKIASENLSIIDGGNANA